MTTPIDYSAVLADLEAQRAKLDVAIVALRAHVGGEVPVDIPSVWLTNMEFNIRMAIKELESLRARKYRTDVDNASPSETPSETPVDVVDIDADAAIRTRLRNRARAERARALRAEPT